MEGPSIHLAAEQLQPFARRRILDTSGNSRIGIDPLNHRVVRDIFPWGKQLLFQFDRFALRVHFLLWGTFAATVRGVSITGDYRRTGPPRLVLEFTNGDITMWSASLRFLETTRARDLYDFSADVLSDTWNPRAALKKARQHADAEIADVLLDQNIFAAWATSSRTRFCTGREPVRSLESATCLRAGFGPSLRTRAPFRSVFSSCAALSR